MTNGVSRIARQLTLAKDRIGSRSRPVNGRRWCPRRAAGGQRQPSGHSELATIKRPLTTWGRLTRRRCDKEELGKEQSEGGGAGVEIGLLWANEREFRDWP
jgi:hypothetical protein